MSGKVRAGTPWTRAIVATFADRYPDAFEALEEAIPDGHAINLTTSGRPNHLGAVLWDVQGRREVARVPADHPTLMAAGYAVLHAGRTA